MTKRLLRSVAIAATTLAGLASEGWAVREGVIHAQDEAIISQWVPILLIMLTIAGVASVFIVALARRPLLGWILAIPAAVLSGWAGWALYVAGTPVEIPGVGLSNPPTPEYQWLGGVLMACSGVLALTVVARGVLGLRQTMRP